MARIRSIYTEQWTDPEFVSCSPLARLIALGIRNVADDNGVFEWCPRKLHLQLLPADNCDVSELLGELEGTNQVYRYVAKGKEYGLIRSFQKFQSPKHPSFKYPTPDDIPDGYEIKQIWPVPKEQGSPTGAMGEGGGKPGGGLPHGVGVGVGVGVGSGEGVGVGKKKDNVKSEADSTDALPCDDDPEAEESEVEEPDPLEAYPKIGTRYPGIWRAVQDAHPKAKIPKPDSKPDKEARDTLAKLVRIDGFTEERVINVLRWLLRDESDEAQFWRSNVATIGPRLRTKTKAGLSKFAAIAEAYEKTVHKQKPITPATPQELAKKDPDVLKLTAIMEAQKPPPHYLIERIMDRYSKNGHEYTPPIINAAIAVLKGGTARTSETESAGDIAARLVNKGETE